MERNKKFLCKLRSFSKILLVVTILAASVFVGNKAEAAADATMTLTITPQTVNIGDMVTLVAKENPGTNSNVRAVDIYLQFDATKLRLDSITNNATAFPVEMANNIPPATADGTATFGTARVGGAALVGEQTVATFSFTALAAGVNSPVIFTAGTAVWDSGVNVTAPGGLTGALITISAGAAPVISQVTPVSDPTNDATPQYVFNSTKAGTITYGGSCTSATTSAVSGNNTISFDTLAAGTYSDCTITVTDASLNISNLLTVDPFTIDLTAPVLAEVTPVTTPSNDATPQYIFNSTKAGTIVYGGGCSSATTSAISGDNTISFSTLASGTYSNCTVGVRDGALNLSNVITVSSFTVDASAPAISSVSPTGTLAVGTTSATVSFVTNENAICSWAATSGVAFASMTNIITGTPNTTHSFAVNGLVNGGSYGYFVRCQDLMSNASSSDYLISFSVANPSTSSNHGSGKKSSKPRSLSVTKKTVKFGEVITQRGKKFTKNNFVLLYFGKPGGGFHAPQKVKTSASGTFAVTYKVNKPKGQYGWYAVDVKTGKKSKTVYYKVK